MLDQLTAELPILPFGTGRVLKAGSRNNQSPVKGFFFEGAHSRSAL